ncbi:MAG: hypothetical protein QMD13_02620 [Candidatus Bathyarchaeia archaeon]|nr:hypothetical protein [Candidatus Bathyarchaeia archaeon]MDI6904373.1 hypothetical protein [Candidatus Bathyarchaeia archaeon]
MGEAEREVTVRVRFGDVEQTFTGSVEDVWLSLNRFFGEFLPSFEVARKLVLSVDLQKLVEECEGLIAFSPEGVNLLVSKDRLTDNETLALWLLANYVGHQLSMIESDAVSKEELQAKLGKSGKITSTRLGELVKSDVVVKTDDDKYRITTFGVVQIQKDIIPRIKAKMGS